MQDSDDNDGGLEDEAYRELLLSARVYYKNDKRIDWGEWEHLTNEARELGLTEEDALRAARNAINPSWSPPLPPPVGSKWSALVHGSSSAQADNSGGESLQARSLASHADVAFMASRLDKGTVINGTYRLEEQIGSGGMGVVWRAVHTTLGTKVAIKFLRRAMDEESAARFVREARTAAKLHSRHLARVFDCAQLETGQLFIVMEYFKGMGLDERLARDGPLDVEESVDFILQACIGLAAAHKSDIVHRDIKPANLFLAECQSGSEVKIVDFGLSRLAQPEDGEGLTRDEILLGTPEYAPPEQFGNAMSAREPADIWALGATLYSLLSGLPPFPKDPNLDGLIQISDLLKRVTEAEPESLNKTRPEVPHALDRVIQKCLEKSPSNRYPSVVDLALDLVPFGSRNAKAHVIEVESILPGSKSEDGSDSSRSRVTVLNSTGAENACETAQTTRRSSAKTSSKWMILVAVGISIALFVSYLVNYR